MQPSSIDTAADDARTPAWLVALLVTTLGLWTGTAVFFSAGVLPMLFLNL
jgi:hypothetical protein